MDLRGCLSWVVRAIVAVGSFEVAFGRFGRVGY